MKSYLKTIGIGAGIILVLLACIVVLIGSAGAIFLNTYNVFTQRVPVAEVIISGIKNDEFGSYAEVKVNQYKRDSALAAVYGQADTSKLEMLPETNYKIYGDTIYVSGPIIKFKDPLILINFKTIYKLGKVYGRYDLDNNKEINKPAEAQQQSSYDVNGGFADWKPIFDNLNAQNLNGSFYRLFIDTTQISSAGIFIGQNEQKYTFYMTNLGFLWELKE